MPKSFRSHLTSLVIAVTSLCAGAAHAQYATNLLVNPGADAVAGSDGTYAANLPGWSVTGELTAIDYSLGCPGGYPCTTDPVPPDHGPNMFGGGNVGSSSGTQNVNLGFAGSAIAGSGARYSLSGWLGGYASQEDNARLTVTFLGASNQVLGTSTIGPVSAADRGNSTAMLLRQSGGWVPTGAVSADVTLQMTRTGGTSNDGYADSLSLSLFQANAVLSGPSSVAFGSTFSTRVAVNAPFAGTYTGDELLAFGFDLNYDHSVLRLAGVQVAAGWDNDSASLTDTAVAGSHFPGVADAGQASEELATLTFEVIGSGQSFIEISSDAANNPNEGVIYAGGPSTELFGRTSVEVTAVPEPPAELMAAVGVMLLLLARRRSV